MLSHEILSQCVDASTGSTERLTFVSSGKGEVRRSKFRFINCYFALVSLILFSWVCHETCGGRSETGLCGFGGSGKREDGKGWWVGET